MHGWIILDKPLGLGSTQAVSAVKRALRQGGYGKAKVGHVSEMKNERVEKPGDVVSEGQEVKVKVLEIDPRGKVRLSMRVVDQETGAELEDTRPPREPREGGDRGPRGDRGDRGRHERARRRAVSATRARRVRALVDGPAA